MKYITGIHALNIPCALNTEGDWHQSSLQWTPVPLYESSNMFFKEYGIEYDKVIPEHTKRFAVANHIRALLDLLEMQRFSIAQGMKENFIGTDEYNKELFEKVWMMRQLPQWEAIDRFMETEYRTLWIRFSQEQKPTSSTNREQIC